MAAAQAPAHDDLLQALLAAKDPATGRGLTRRQILDNLMMMVVAGHEPPASALAWAIYLLATHPEAQDRVRREVLASVDETLEADAPFLNAVIHETMRLYPVVPILLRDTVKPDRVGSCPVSAGSFMFVPLYAMHRSPANWQDPDRFRPERFMPGAAPNRAFLPFSTGARACIGRTFALAEIRIVLADIVSRFRFSATQGRTPIPAAVMSLRPKGGVWIDAERL